MKRMSALILCILVVSGVKAQDLENVMMILGTTDPEDMTEQDMERFEKELYCFFESEKESVLLKVKNSEKMDDTLRQELDKAIAEFTERF